MFVIDLTSKASVDGFEDLSNKVQDISTKLGGEMSEEDTLWIFCSNISTEDDFCPASMKVAEIVQNNTGMNLRDIITINRNLDVGNFFRESYEDVLLFVQNKNEYKFDKDSIRVEPVYEGNEWNGLRENGHSAYRDRSTKRYNPDGKDPGNVWLEEIRTETESNVLDRTEPIPRVEAIRRCIRVGSANGDTVSAIWPGDEMKDAIVEEGRKMADISNNYTEND